MLYPAIVVPHESLYAGVQITLDTAKNTCSLGCSPTSEGKVRRIPAGRVPQAAYLRSINPP